MLRHTFAATAAEMGFSEPMIAGLLGHSVPGVTARYAHVADSDWCPPDHVGAADAEALKKLKSRLYLAAVAAFQTI